MKNKYMIHYRIFEKKFMEILKYFCLDLEAKKNALLCQISQQSLCKIFKQIRILIAKECEKISKMSGDIKDGENYFLLRFTRNCVVEGAKRVRGKRRRDAGKRRLCFYFVLRILRLQIEGALLVCFAKFRGIKKENFVLYLKETEFRYNTKILGQNLYQNLLKLIRGNPVKFN